jgi:hypothetical protein
MRDKHGRGASINYERMDSLIASKDEHGNPLGTVAIAKQMGCSDARVTARKKKIGAPIQSRGARLETKTTGRVLGWMGFDYAQALEKDFRTIHRQFYQGMPYEVFREQVNEVAKHETHRATYQTL